MGVIGAKNVISEDQEASFGSENVFADEKEAWFDLKLFFLKIRRLRFGAK